MDEQITSNETDIGQKAVNEKLKAGSKERTNRKRVKHDSGSDSDKLSKPVKKVLQLETDPLILQRRQKQVDYGKNTVGYNNFMQQVPMEQRTKDHPRTPDKYSKYSRRSWDMLIKMWRKQLHSYDPNGGSENADESDESLDK